MATAFIGVDLAWNAERRNSGLAAFSGDESGADPVEFDCGAIGLDRVVDFIESKSGANCVVAIDAPLIVRNPTGQRPCETLVSRKFGRYEAGAHSSNLSHRYASGVALASRLESLGFRHCTPPTVPWQSSGRWFFEVYPHPAQVVLFERTRTIKYKKGRVAMRKLGLDELRCEIRERVLGADPSLRASPPLQDFLRRDLAPLEGTTTKLYEDALDATLCSYLAFHLWRWGWDRSEFLGDLGSGYIVVPTSSLPIRTPLAVRSGI